MTELAEGHLRYELQDCDAERFPFTEVLDLEFPEGPVGSNLPSFWIEDAVGIGSRVMIVEPTEEDIQLGKVYHPISEPLDVSWAHEGSLPDVRGRAMEVDKGMFFRNHDVGQAQAFEALACLPGSEDALTLTATDLLQFEPNPDTATQTYYSSLQVDTAYQSPAFTTEWGRSVRVQSIVTDGGLVHLHE